MQHDGLTPSGHVGSEPLRIVETPSLLLRTRPANGHEQPFVVLEPVLRPLADDGEIDIGVGGGISPRTAPDERDRASAPRSTSAATTRLTTCTVNYRLQRSSVLSPGSAKPSLR